VFFPTAITESSESPWRADLPRARQLVAAPWLARLLSGLPVSAAPARAWCLFEVDDGDWHAGHPGHVPGATWFDTNLLELLPIWNRLPDTLLLQRLQALGIRHDTTVVLTGRHLTAAARVAQLLLLAGVTDVRLLDGGTQAWQRAGLPLQRDAPQRPNPVSAFGLHLPACPHWLIDTAQVRAILDHPEATLVSIRSHDEFMGRTSGYASIPALGDIAGARWGRAGASDDMNCMRDFHTSQGRMKPAAEILRFWRDEGIRADRHVAFFCGTGWRASLAFFYAWLMGWDDISVYDGGWLEWSADPRNPTINRQPAGHTPRGARRPGAAPSGLLPVGA